jgi:hypothetical protein
MNSDPKQSRSKRFTIAIVTRCLATIVAASFLATLLPIYSASAKSSMACCVGKTSSHCHVDLKAKKPAAHDHSSDSSNGAFKVTAAQQLCHSDCCACFLSSRQQRRDGVAAATIARHSSPFTTRLSATTHSAVFHANERRTQTSPRGPPFFFQQIA